MELIRLTITFTNSKKDRHRLNLRFNATDKIEVLRTQVQEDAIHNNVVLPEGFTLYLDNIRIPSYLRIRDTVAEDMTASICKTVDASKSGKDSFIGGAAVGEVDFHKLVAEGLKIRPKVAVVTRALKKFPDRAQLAFFINDPDLAGAIYDDALALPQTSTELQLKLAGIQLSGALVGGSDTVTLCFKGTVPCVLKSLTPTEATRMKLVLERLADTRNPHIVNIELTTPRHDHRSFAIMPLLSSTLAHLQQLSSEDATKFWEHLEVALLCLHNVGLAHNDVKPSNICIDYRGDFVLIDLGSTTVFGHDTQSTAAYVPFHVEGGVSAASLDWWMAAATLSERACGDKTWGQNANNPTCERLCATLASTLSPTLWAKVKSHLD